MNNDRSVARLGLALGAVMVLSGCGRAVATNPATVFPPPTLPAVDHPAIQTTPVGSTAPSTVPAGSQTPVKTQAPTATERTVPSVPTPPATPPATLPATSVASASPAPETFDQAVVPDRCGRPSKGNPAPQCPPG